MNVTVIILGAFLLIHPLCSKTQNLQTFNAGSSWTLAIHGGAGGPGRGVLSQKAEQQYLDSLNRALDIGSQILMSGGTALDAVEAVVRYMEDCPLFNAGKGAVYNAEGQAELDASIMDGKTLMAGAVAGVHRIKNPIVAARLVMERTPHVLLMSDGAEEFARSEGLERVRPSYFQTKSRTEQYEKMKKKMKAEQEEKHGTVGAAARDIHGNLAAATSTGGMMMKMKGRLGDTPIIGAGTYADNATCAVSCTGHGEYFIRFAVAHDLSALMKYKQMTLSEAADLIINKELPAAGGTGGLIAVDHDGNIAMPFNTKAMFRGWNNSKGEKGTAIYPD